MNVVSKAEFDALTKINGEGSENSGEGCDGLRGKPEAEQTVAGASPALSTTHYSTTREEFRAAVARDPGAVFTPIAEDATQSSESDPDAFKVKAAL